MRLFVNVLNVGIIQSMSDNKEPLDRDDDYYDERYGNDDN